MKPQGRPTPYNGTGPGTRALRSEQVAALVWARGAGAGAKELAEEYGVARRTVYRWFATKIVEAEVGGWTARFAIREPKPGSGYREGPVQLTPWVKL